MNGKVQFGIDKLRRAVNLFSNCSESFNQIFTEHQLLKLADAYSRCDYDITPDKWAARQIREALKFGRAPKWSDDVGNKPLYDESSNK